MEYLLFIAIAGAMAYILLFTGLGERHGALERALCSAPALAVFALALFALWRWQGLEVASAMDPGRLVKVTSPGRSGVIGLQLLALGLVLGFVLGGQPGDRALFAWRLFRRVLIVAALAFGLLAFYQYFVSYDRALASLRSADASMDPLMRQSLEHALTERRVGGNLGNGNVFAALLSVLAVFCISGWSPCEPRFIRALSLLAFVAAAFATLLTGSRGGLLTFAMATVGALALLRWMPSSVPPGGDAAAGAKSKMDSENSKKGKRNRNRKKHRATHRSRLPRIAALALLIITALGVTAVPAESPIRRLTKVTTIRERLTYWRIATQIGSESPLLGRSPGAFQLYYPRHKPPEARESRYAHSWLFQIGCELGLLGLSLMGLFWSGVARAGFSIFRAVRSAVASQGVSSFSRHHHEAAWLALAAGVLGANGLFEYSLQLEEFLMLLGVLAGGAMALTSQAKSEQGENATGDKTRPKGPAKLQAKLQTAPGRLSYRLVAGLTLFFLGTAALGWQVPHRQMGIRWKWRAEGALQSGDRESAARFYAHASGWQPDNEGYLIGRGAALAGIEGSEAQALEILALAKERNPVSARVRQLEARVLENLGEFDKALARLDEAISLYPNDAGYRLDRADSNLELGRTQAARDDLTFIDDNALPIWSYQRPLLDMLREELGQNETPA